MGDKGKVTLIMDGPKSYYADCTLQIESLLLIECQNLQHVVHKRKLLQKNIKKEERKKKNQKFKVKGAVLFLIELVKRQI